jgi:hypothetical protein
MKKTLKPLATALAATALATALCLSLAPISAVGAETTIKVFVDGKQLNMDVPPIIYNDRTMVPVRAISEAVGCVVDWFPDDMRVVVNTPGNGYPFIEMRIDDHNVTIYHHANSGSNGRNSEAGVGTGAGAGARAGASASTDIGVWTEAAAVDVKPMIVNGRTLVPLRFIAEWMGFDVGWDEKDNTVRIASGLSDAKLAEKLTGLWHASNMVGSGFNERFALYPDGTFIYGSNEMAGGNSELYRTGSWSASRGRLILTTRTRVVAENGYFAVTIREGTTLVDADYAVRLENPPKRESYPIDFLGADPDTGREMLKIDYLTLFKFNNQADLMDGYDALMSRLGWVWPNDEGKAIEVTRDVAVYTEGGKDYTFVGGVLQKGCFYHDGMGEWQNYYYVEIGPGQYKYITGAPTAPPSPIEIQVYSTEYDLEQFLWRYIEFSGEHFEAHTIHHRRDIVFEIKQIFR